jgi:hypothetical protein
MDIQRLTDAEVAQVINAGPETLRKLVERGFRRNHDGTWNAYRLFGFMAKQLTRESRTGGSKHGSDKPDGT